VIQPAWAFTMDGHVFYVLSLGDKTLVCDLTTGQWSRWFTGTEDLWNAHRGIMWQGYALAADGSGDTIWRIDPLAELDEEALTIARAATGFTPIRGRKSYRQGSLRLTVTAGQDETLVGMRFSDDEGESWSSIYPIMVEEYSFGKRLEWRSLGRLRAPGRIWEITDEGGALTIEGLDSNHEVEAK
jgi:hypothetical protein